MADLLSRPVDKVAASGRKVSANELFTSNAVERTTDIESKISKNMKKLNKSANDMDLDTSLMSNQIK